MANNLIKFFKYDHLPPHLQEISKMFYDLAIQIEAKIPQTSEQTVSLRKLLESKDCAIRAVVEMNG